MEEQNIRKYAELMNELGLTGLEFNESGNIVRLERSTAPAKGVYAPEPAAASASQPAAKPASSSLKEILSPMVGVFYRAPMENAVPFVQVGDQVRKGDVVCIIESMKLMNEIRAEEEGIVEEICVENTEVVDFGRVLFRLSPM
ncbi:MAG: acetyl-CoA carboxylase biotin carboxyl carrier protein [Clostridiales bacterium]|nr:acetyl-CoA carboxylase biotin carboxyl carrier protein [Clostridiales bacterium]